MRYRKYIQDLQAEITEQKRALNLLQARLVKRSYKLTDSELQELHYQADNLRNQLFAKQEQLARLKSGYSPNAEKQSISLKIVMATSFGVGVLLYLLLSFVSHLS